MGNEQRELIAHRGERNDPPNIFFFQNKRNFYSLNELGARIKVLKLNDFFVLMLTERMDLDAQVFASHPDVPGYSPEDKKKPELEHWKVIRKGSDQNSLSRLSYTFPDLSNRSRVKVIQEHSLDDEIFRLQTHLTNTGSLPAFVNFGEHLYLYPHHEQWNKIRWNGYHANWMVNQDRPIPLVAENILSFPSEGREVLLRFSGYHYGTFWTAHVGKKSDSHYLCLGLAENDPNNYDHTDSGLILPGKTREISIEIQVR